jgi:protein-S-isoprenylcysteine O-methyltransferase Ste14
LSATPPPPPTKTSRTPWQRIAKRIRVPMGFLVAAFFLWLAHPTPRTLLLSLLLVLPGLWLRAYAAGYVRKNAELTSTGPYAHTRNPLYLGSMLIAFGFGAASASPFLLLALAVLFLAIYLPTIQGEEQYLRVHFPNFDTYAATVPRLLPRLTPARDPNGPADPGSFSRSLYLHHREYNASMGAAAIYLALALKLVFKHHQQLSGLAGR